MHGIQKEIWLKYEAPVILFKKESTASGSESITFLRNLDKIVDVEVVQNVAS